MGRERTWLFALLLGTVLLAAGPTQPALSAADECASAQDSTVQEINKAIDRQIVLLSALSSELQSRGEDPHKYKATTPTGTVETIDLVETISKLTSLKTEAAKAVADAARDCIEKSTGTAKITELVGIFEGRLSLTLPPKAVEIDLSDILNGKPLGGPNSEINKIPDAVLKGDNGTIANVIRDPLAAMKFLGRQLSTLPKGNIVLLAPKEMKIGDKRQVDANVGINVSLDVLEKKLRADQQQVTGEAHLSSEMIATLQGAGFTIKPLTPEKQTIAEGFPTVWSWNIEAKESGDQDLEATLYALVPNGDTDARQRVDSYAQKISVTVREKTWSEWLKSVEEGIDSVKAILVTLVGAATAVLGWFGIQYTRRDDARAKKKSAKEEGS